jgi:hypothetical protein
MVARLLGWILDLTGVKITSNIQSEVRSMGTVTNLLTTEFGITFARASLDQKLALIEAIGFLMREQNQTLGYALLIIVPGVVMPEHLVSANSKICDLREGLTLLALLYGSVNKVVPPALPPEDYL